ncbi:RDD family protein [Streptomyces sudanensis]|uniref:RDD family protein n=1 Tax=Streptomyces sudanensis TaxID=436397 RepID=UPI0020CDF5A8|nr:RDD family protein [Streptomyces sudanensis]MCP9958833.1 RDD family protein [Streptomyces sudanensis]MCQ0000687.1 RDD family protein [Streptomyces sudanensis]
MSAPTPATGDGSPEAGYYPDPSIPGYIRYWSGAAWVPGTSRPAPAEGEAAPVPPVPAAPSRVPAVEETGPVFLDEDPDMASEPGPGTPAHGAGTGPASAWRSDAAPGQGPGDGRGVPWGAAGRPDPRVPAAADPPGGVPPGAGRAESGPGSGPGDAMAVRASGPGAPRTPDAPVPYGPHSQPQGPQSQGHQPHGPQSQPQAYVPAPAVRPQPAPAHRVPPQAAAPAAPAAAVDGGDLSWAQQVHRLARPQPGTAQPQPGTAQPQPGTAQPQPGHVPPQSGPALPGDDAAGQPVVPWKPPVSDPFLRAVQERAAARPAGLGRRFAARLVDGLVLGALAGAAGAPFVLNAVDHIRGKIEQAERSGETVRVWLVDGTTSVQFGIALGILLVLGVLYEALPTARWGRTLGKKLCGTEVRGIESHEPPSFGAALRRWLVYAVLGLTGIGVLNVAWCLFDRPWRQCWHDKAAGTFVAGR